MHCTMPLATNMITTMIMDMDTAMGMGTATKEARITVTVMVMVTVTAMDTKITRVPLNKKSKKT